MFHIVSVAIKCSSPLFEIIRLLITGFFQGTELQWITENFAYHLSSCVTLTSSSDCQLRGRAADVPNIQSAAWQT